MWSDGERVVCLGIGELCGCRLEVMSGECVWNWRVVWEVECWLG